MSQNELVPMGDGHLRRQFATQDGDTKNIVLRQSALNALRHWWKVAFPVGLALAAIAAGIVHLTDKPQYQSRATLLIEEHEPYVVFPDARSDSERFVRTQQEIIRSALVMGPVVSREEIAKLPEVAQVEEPIDTLAEKVSFKSRGNSDLYDISFTGPNPKNSALIVNAVVDAYFKLRDEYEAQRDSKIIELLESERAEHGRKVTRLQETVRNLTKQTAGQDTFQPAVKPEIGVANPLTILRSRLTEGAVAQAMLRAEIAAMEQIDKANPVETSDEEVNQLVSEHGEVTKLEAEIAQKRQVQREIAVRSAHGERDSKYKEKEADIQRTQELLDQTRKDLSAKIREEVLAQRTQARSDELSNKRIQLENASLLEGILEKQLQEKMETTAAVGVDNLELEFKRDELIRAETVFEMIAQRIVKLTTEQRAPRRVELLQAAVAPKVPLQQLPMKMMLLAGAAAMACPFLLAFAWEWRTQRLSDSHQLTVFSTVPVVAEIASFPARARSSHRALPRSVTRGLRHFEESVHSLRTYISLSQSLNDVKVLAVTSSISQEGKTSVAAQLALSFSRSSGRVLLIDGDLRAPDVHKMFDIERGPGLAEVLQGEVGVAEAIHTEWSADIHILPAGRLKCDPHQLMGTGGVEKLVAELREQYGTIIIDTPPVLAASEALVFAKAADATLLCTMRDVSRLAQVKNTYNRLIDSGARPVGAVFSGVPMASYYRTYGDYEYAPHS